MKLKLTPQKLAGQITVPPSKSQAHRLLMATVPLRGECVINNISLSDDIKATLNVLTALGKEVDICKDKNSLLIKNGIGTVKPLPVIDCKESGSTLRFAIPMALAVNKGAIFTGEGRLGERPLTPYKDIFEKNGITWSTAEKGFPLTVAGNLNAGVYRLPGNLSSQFVTGLLMALPLIPGDSVIEIDGPLESAPYVDITLDVLKKFGINIIEKEAGQRYFIPGNSTYKQTEVTVEGDWSQAAFHIAAGILGNGVTILGLDQNSCQGDKVILDFVKRMGADIGFHDRTLYVNPSKLTGCDLNITNCPDLAPVLCLLCALAKGRSRITGAGRLRIKESDRIESITGVLRKLGADAKTTDEGFEFNGVAGLHGSDVSSYGDHRIAMMAAIAVSACCNSFMLEGGDAINKSYPEFWDDYKKLGGKAL